MKQHTLSQLGYNAADLNGSLLQLLSPPLETDERQLAAIEGSGSV
jgi:hypothetical protein